MVSSVFVNQWLLALMLFVGLFWFKLGAPFNERLIKFLILRKFVKWKWFVTGKGDTGIAGTGLGYLPEPGGGSSGSSDDSGGGESSGGSDDKPDEIVLKALKCFNEKEVIISSHSVLNAS